MTYDLSIDVLQAEGLVPVDDDETARPFVTIQLMKYNAETQEVWRLSRLSRTQFSTSEAKERSLNPKFPEEGRSTVFEGLEEGKWALEVKVMDHNPWRKSKMMGQVIILNVPSKESLGEKWYPLTSEEDLFSQNLGRVQLNLAFSSSETKSSRQLMTSKMSSFLTKPFSTKTGSGSQADEKNTKNASLQGMAHAPPSVDEEVANATQAYNSSSSHREPNLLRIFIAAATQPEKEVRSKKYFCHVSFREQHFATKKRSDCIWNQDSRLLLHAWDGDIDTARIELRVHEDGRLPLLNKHKVIAKADIQVTKASDNIVSLDLEPKMRKIPKICLRLAWRFEYDPSVDASSDAGWFDDFTEQDASQPAETIPDQVHLVVCRAQKLRAADTDFLWRSTTSDPYAKVTIVQDFGTTSSSGSFAYGGAWAQTHVVEKELNPVWNARFILPIDRSKVMSDEKTKLLLEVYDKDQYSSDDFLGRVLIPISPTVGHELSRKQRTAWYMLEGEDAEGEVLVATYARSSSSPGERTQWRPQSESDDSSEFPNELRVAIVYCTLGEDHDQAGNLSIIFKVVRTWKNGKDEKIVQEWQSKSVAPGTWQEEMAWPLRPRDRDDRLELRAFIVCKNKNAVIKTGSVNLVDLQKIRPLSTDRTLESPDGCSCIKLVLQWRYNKALAENKLVSNDMLFEYGIVEEGEGSVASPPPSQDGSTEVYSSKGGKKSVPAPNKHETTLPSIVRRIRAGNVQAVRPLHTNALSSYAAFVPAFVSREIAAKRTSLDPQDKKIYDYGRALQFSKQVDAAVLFADISGFTKLTEKLCARLNGAELLCSELDLIYGALCDEASFLGGDAVKFAGDAICFMWIVGDEGTGGIDIKTATRRAALCAQRLHLAVRRHPPVEGVKLTLHAGLSCGSMTCLALTRERPAGQRERAEFVVAGKPMEHIGVAEPLAKPGTTVCSPEAWTHLSEVFEGQETNENPDYMIIDRAKADNDEAICTKPSCGLMSATLKLLLESDIVYIAPFVPKAFDRILRNKHATATFLSHAKHAKAEIRELTVAFLKFEGLDMGDPEQLEKARKMMQVVDWVLAHFDGSLNKLIVDDKGTLALVVFGLPGSVHANAPKRCIAAIRLLRERLKAIEIRCSVGITTARTFCGAVGSRQRMEYTVMGDSVNLAARLMAASAETDRPCLVDKSTEIATKDELKYETHEPIKVKGKSEEILIFEPNFVDEDRQVEEDDHSGTDDLLRYESHLAKFNELADICRKVFCQNGTNRAQHVSVCVVRGLDGTSAAADLMHSMPKLFSKAELSARNVQVLRCIKSKSIYADGVLRATTVAGAWRGPIVAAMSIIAGQEACTSLNSDLLKKAISDFDEDSGRHALADMFLSQDLPEEWNSTGGHLSAAYAKDAWKRSIEQGNRVARFVIEVIQRAACIKPLCIILDNLVQMDTTAWDIANKLARNDKKSFSSTTDGSVEYKPVLLCVLAPRSEDEGLRRAEWASIADIGKELGNLVDVSPLKDKEILIYAAEVLSDIYENVHGLRDSVLEAIEKNDNLVRFIYSSNGVRDVLRAMLIEAKQFLWFEIDKDTVIVKIFNNSNLMASAPPRDHAGIVLAAIDGALSMQEHLVVRAASVFWDGFTASLIHNLCPINIEPCHISDIISALCNPLDSGRRIFKKREQCPPKLKDLAAAGPVDVVFDFVEPLLQKAIANTLLDAQLEHVLSKIGMLPVTSDTDQGKWKSALLHPFLRHKTNRMGQE